MLVAGAFIDAQRVLLLRVDESTGEKILEEIFPDLVESKTFLQFLKQFRLRNESKEIRRKPAHNLQLDEFGLMKYLKELRKEILDEYKQIEKETKVKENVRKYIVEERAKG